MKARNHNFHILITYIYIYLFKKILANMYLHYHIETSNIPVLFF